MAQANTVENNYFSSPPCAVCRRRECVHKENDRFRSPEEFIDPSCKHCNGTGLISTVAGMESLKLRRRNGPCFCKATDSKGRRKKYKHCHGSNRQDVSSKVTSKIPCSCVAKRITKYMVERVKMPCSICGQDGHCKHRPQFPGGA